MVIGQKGCGQSVYTNNVISHVCSSHVWVGGICKMLRSEGLATLAKLIY